MIEESKRWHEGVIFSDGARAWDLQKAEMVERSWSRSKLVDPVAARSGEPIS